jgi:putative ABC transport system ATP-binding protein
MAIGGLERITRGTIRVAGQELARLSEDELAVFRRDNVGIVFQSFHLIATMTALENVAVPLEFRGLDDAFARARLNLEQVGLGHRLGHYPGQLSGGEQQRVAIARAVAAGAQMIMADEPTGNLDQQTGQEIMDLLFALPRDHGTTLLLVTHDRALAESCDRVIEIRDGRIVAEAE